MAHETDLSRKHCAACEGGTAPTSPEQLPALLAQIPDWHITADGKRIRREWQAKNFLAAMDFFQRVAEVAEHEGHHPDLHLVAYRHMSIEIWTHATNGLTENDFILAAKIDQLESDLQNKTIALRA